jgi:hypothetical protein
MRISIKNTVVNLPDEVALTLIEDGIALPYQQTTIDQRESCGLAMPLSQKQDMANKPRRSSKDSNKTITK